MHIKNPPPWKLYTVTKQTDQGVDTIMISNAVFEHALTANYFDTSTHFLFLKHLM
jgi:hypothetical protein